MERGKTGLQVRPSQLFSFHRRFSVPTIVLNLDGGPLDGHDHTQHDHAEECRAEFSIRRISYRTQPTVRRMVPTADRLWGQRNDNLLPFLVRLRGDWRPLYLRASHLGGSGGVVCVYRLHRRLRLFQTGSVSTVTMRISSFNSEPAKP